MQAVELSANLSHTQLGLPLSHYVNSAHIAVMCLQYLVFHFTTAQDRESGDADCGAGT